MKNHYMNIFKNKFEKLLSLGGFMHMGMVLNDSGGHFQVPQF